MVQGSKVSFEIEPSACILGAALLLAVPLGWVCAWIGAVFVHELFHCLSLIVCGGAINSIKIGLGGAIIQSSLFDRRKQLICTLAGPFGGLLLLPLGSVFPKLALCAFLQTAFNLLPVMPLDGGNALNALLQILLPDSWGHKVFGWIETVFVCICILSCVAAAVLLKNGIFLLVFLLIFLLRIKKIKIPCKSSFCKVQ